MAQTNYTPIALYNSTTAAAVPVAGNLVNGELAVNITDGKLYYKDNLGAVKLLASNAAAGGTFAAPVVIEGTTTDAALRITQLGTGNALLVEDSTNPDATPFVIDATGNVLIGSANSVSTFIGEAKVQVLGNSNTTSQVAIGRFSNDVDRPRLNLYKSRSTTIGTNTILQNNDAIGDVVFQGADGTNYIIAARISAEIDGVPGLNDMPGRLIFSTTADGASSPTERMRIDSAGQVGIGGASTAGVNFRLAKSLTGSTNAYSAQALGTIQSDVTGAAWGVLAQLNTAAASFSTQTRLFQASQGAIGAGSTLSSQIGFYVDSSLTGATNNYGFYGDIAFGAGRFNLYMNGTANNYMAGSLGIGAVPSAGQSLLISKNITGATTSFAVNATATVQSDVTNAVIGYRSNISTAAAAFTLPSIYHYQAIQGTIGATSALTSQFGFVAESSLIGATNNYGFYGSIPAGTGRYNLYMGGTAANYLGGQLQLGQDYIEKTNVANTSTAITLDLTNGTFQVLTLTGSPTITMPTAVAGKSFVILLKTGTGSFTVTWSTVKWPGGTAPTITSTASKQDIFSFFSDGTNWYGTTVGQNYTP